MLENGVSATSNVYVLLSLAGLLVSLDIWLNKTITIYTLYVVGIVIAIILGTRILVELSARQIYRLKIKREFLDPPMERNKVRIKLVFRNNSSIPLFYVSINDLYPSLFKLVEGSNTVSATLLPYSGFEYEYIVETVLGKHLFRGLEIIVKDPLGLFNYKTTIDPEEKIIYVKPKPATFPRRMIGIWTRRGLGIGKARMRGLGQEFYELREYFPGDDYRLIDWKSFARLRKLYVKEFEREANLSVVFIIDASPDSMRGIVGGTPLEDMARITAGLSKILLERGDWVGVVIRGEKIVRSGYGRGRIHFMRIINSLSNIDWHVKEPSISLGGLIVDEASKLPRRAKTLFFVLTTLLNRSEADELINASNKLRSLGHLVFIVQLIPELYEEKYLKGLESAIFSGLTLDRYVLSKQIREYLGRRGVRVVSVGPDDIYVMIYRLIESYRAVIV